MAIFKPSKQYLILTTVLALTSSTCLAGTISVIQPGQYTASASTQYGIHSYNGYSFTYTNYNADTCLTSVAKTRFFDNGERTGLQYWTSVADGAYSLRNSAYYVVIVDVNIEYKNSCDHDVNATIHITYPKDASFDFTIPAGTTYSATVPDSVDLGQVRPCGQTPVTVPIEIDSGKVTLKTNRAHGNDMYLTALGGVKLSFDADSASHPDGNGSLTLLKSNPEGVLSAACDATLGEYSTTVTATVHTP